MKIISIFLLLTVFVGCTDKNNEKITDADVIASHKNGTIEFSELNEYINFLPLEKKWNNSHDLMDWYEQTIKQMIVDKSIIDEAKLTGFDKGNTYEIKRQHLYRNFYTNQYFNQIKFLNDVIDAEEIKAYYNDNKSDYIFPEKRKVYNIFIANSIPSSIAEEKIKELKRRIDSGESFPIIAGKHSESESRHESGLIGMLKEGLLSETFDQVVFSLEKNVPSEIVQTKEGFHIFIVTDIIPSQQFEFNDVKTSITRELTRTYIINKVETLVEELESHKDLELIDSEKLFRLYKSGQFDTTVIKLNDFSMTLKGFVEYLQLQKFEPKTPSETYDLLKEVAYRQLILHDTKDDLPKSRPDSLMYLENQLLVEQFLPIKMTTYLNQNPEVVQEYYQNNIMRFSSPILLSFNYLEFKKENRNEIMPQLEVATKKLNTGLLSYEDFIDTFNPEVTLHHSRSDKFISQLDSKIKKHIYQIKPGQFSAPYTLKGAIVLIYLTDRTEAVPQPLSLIRQQVVNAFIKENAGFLYNQISAEYLEDLQINSTQIQQIHDQLTSF